MSAADTQVELIATAERLFANDGIDGPSLRSLNRAAGQRNTGALRYHFGDRDELLRAILAKHEGEIKYARDGLLDQAELREVCVVRDLAAALVLPPAQKLGDPEGRYYLQILGEIIGRPRRFSSILQEVLRTPSLTRWSRTVEPLIPPAAVGAPLHRRFAVVRFVQGELASRARESNKRDHRLFTSQLVDLVEGLLLAPVSGTTKKLILPERPGRAKGKA
jgi:AcrR family transcriptional regulator